MRTKKLHPTERAARSLLKINPGITSGECARKIKPYLAYLKSRNEIGLGAGRVYA